MTKAEATAKERTATIAKVAKDTAAAEERARPKTLAEAVGTAAAKSAAKSAASGPLSPANFVRSTGIQGTVTEVCPSNPKRKGSKAHAVFEYYRVGETVAELVARLVADGLPKSHATADVRYNVEHGYIVVE